MRRDYDLRTAIGSAPRSRHGAETPPRSLPLLVLLHGTPFPPSGLHPLTGIVIAPAREGGGSGGGSLFGRGDPADPGRTAGGRPIDDGIAGIRGPPPWSPQEPW